MNSIERKKLKFPKNYNPKNLSWDYVSKYEGVYKVIGPKPLDMLARIFRFYTFKHPIKNDSYITFAEDIIIFEKNTWLWPEVCKFKEYRFGYLRLKWWVIKQIINVYMRYKDQQ